MSEMEATTSKEALTEQPGSAPEQQAEHGGKQNDASEEVGKDMAEAKGEEVDDGEEQQEDEWGRVLIAGGTNWATNGRKDRSSNLPSDLPTPHLIRSLLNFKIITLITGCAANYAIVIDINGAAHLFGKVPSSYYAPGGVIPETSPLIIRPTSLGLPRGTKWTHGAAARGHFLLVDSTGGVWGCGNNVTGQLGLTPCPEVEKLTLIPGPWRKASQQMYEVSAGHTFSLFLTHCGKVYAAGSSECGQLGNGKTGERLLKGGKVGFDLEVPPLLVSRLADRRITMVASGNQHSLAMDSEGYVYGWGCAGYSRLGLQDQRDKLVPTLVPSFAGANSATRGASVFCGPTNSVVVDMNGMYWMAGKWKITGDGSAGAPWTSFKTIPDLMQCKAQCASSGGCSHFLTSPNSEGGTDTIGFGQGVLYGELGLGPDQGKSVTRPTRIEPLVGVEVLDVGAGPFATLFLAKPGPALSELTRHPEWIKSDDICLICNEDRGETEPPMECEKCEQPYHYDCLDPPLSAVPEGEWFCPACEHEAEDKEDDAVPKIASQGKNGPTPRNSLTPGSRGKPGSIKRSVMDHELFPGKRGSPGSAKRKRIA